MNCPKDNGELMVCTDQIRATRTSMKCVDCGWESPTLFEVLVAASPAYRLAQLEAKGAKPGWYGPDGERCEVAYDSRKRCYWLTWRKEVQLTEAEARLCGFVEVRND